MVDQGMSRSSMQAWRGLTILKEAHLATYFQLVMLCLGRQEIRSTAVEAVQTGNLRI
ncbi:MULTISPECIES: hypothetical protein [unclassified Bradyrhizobium]|uniref:hypothetical protein n=1 Tax=unclassified Bradyrhizobium TaxID=2631580 RepID=UPI001CD61857|nr:MULTISPECIES: hypothetical protein [unclassified Bradyrhizobium]MCA1378597.1 hypothetical protein [Bradyrhizobium sp. IC4060]MCA1488572.1 hypothetical protein [Bradyrhizobium sp. IC4061]